MRNLQDPQQTKVAVGDTTQHACKAPSRVNYEGAGEMVKLARGLLNKHEAPSSNLQHSHKGRGVHL